MEQSGVKLSDTLLTHCHRKFFHVQWCILLDDEFLEAYEHGIMIAWQDQVKHHIYPWIFTYSADYPEKYWLCYSPMPLANVTCIQSFNCDHQELGKMPMPWGLIPKYRTFLLAMELDLLQCRLLSCSDTAHHCEKIMSARKLIYEKHYAVDGMQIEELLKDESLVPTTVCHWGLCHVMLS